MRIIYLIWLQLFATMSYFVDNPILPLVLAGILQLFLSVKGDTCGTITLAKAGNDYSSLLKKTIANFRSTCRKGRHVHKQGEFLWSVFRQNFHNVWLTWSKAQTYRRKHMIFHKTTYPLYSGYRLQDKFFRNKTKGCS